MTQCHNTLPRQDKTGRLSTLVTLAALILSISLLSGCSFSRPNAEQTSWLVTPERTAPPQKSPVAMDLKMGSFSANPPFDGKSLVYRLSDQRYEKDYYNVYLIYPRDMVQNATRDWLVKSNAFEQVIEQSTVFFPKYQLQGVIDEFYGDYRGQPEAVVAIQFYASTSFSANNYLFSSPRISKRVPVRDKSPQALIDGQQQALTLILTELESRLIADSAKAPEFTSRGQQVRKNQ
jgi:cholesterol transport system auxiliary component